MSAIRPLPPRPSLEHARKEAKALLRRLRAGDPEAVARARARHPVLDATRPERAQLADAQLVVARDHGFASWPRLVRYMGDVARQQHGQLQLHGGLPRFESRVRGLLAEHRARAPGTLRTFAAFVPRFYGAPLDEVAAGAPTEDEARLAVARMQGTPSWQVLLERIEEDARTSWPDDATNPIRRSVEIMRSGDIDALERLVAEYPALLEPSAQDLSASRPLMWMALWRERELGADAMRPIMGWLAARGFDRGRELGLRLRGHMRMRPDEVQMLLDLGADPNWTAPSGIPVLEHALLRYWNGEAVDVLAARATPRKALWIAAGLGDVDGVRRSLDHRGRPVPDASRLRPDFVAVGMPGVAALPDADDEELLLEALLVAVLNGRIAVIEYLASRGAPLNSTLYGMTLLDLAVGNRMTAVAECLVRCGATPERESPA